MDELKNRLAEILVDTIEYACKTTKKQLDDHCWGWSENAVSIVNDLTGIFLVVVGNSKND